MEALSNTWYGSWRPLNNLTQVFQACHLCTFNVAAIFSGPIPTNGVLPYAMIELAAPSCPQASSLIKLVANAWTWTCLWLYNLHHWMQRNIKTTLLSLFSYWPQDTPLHGNVLAEDGSRLARNRSLSCSRLWSPVPTPRTSTDLQLYRAQ